ncbi:hypothetical protein B0F90DRAFT_1710574 [Multifurca ochricompacta]|uniref:Uncharacterized protein n=1 Tax=Multifurca ochricompacta TaxID=376703 RepID=A0AAD4M6M8_9AGAM|nr:hypothetical protein B0F90DRAFT_1710574 [Multifurca ochricompacta]
MLRAHSLPFTHEHDLVPPPPLSVSSPSFQMPTVFVHPPEEEQEEAPPQCVFDATKESSKVETAFTQSKPDDMWPHTVPPSSVDSAQADSNLTIPRPDSSQSWLSSNPNLLGLASIPESPKRTKEREDDDIIEVMKVRRGEGMPDVTYAHGPVHALRKSKTLRSRAVQALRSIKNVGRAPRRPTGEHIILAKENGYTVKNPLTPAPATTDRHMKDLPTQSSTPRLKKRVSQPLSNLFGLGQGNSAAISPNVPVTASTSGRFRTMPYSRSASSSSTPALHLSTDELARPTSPTFSIRGTRHKFSFVNLQSIFSGSTTDPIEPGPEPQSVAPNTEAEESALPRTVQTPVDDEWYPEEDYDSPRWHADLGTMPRYEDESSSPERDIDFEMRLNSLHFDSFSFDADAF